ncbi:hypothetical protein ACSQ67_019166 [Phaseolus vulgaris]
MVVFDQLPHKLPTREIIALYASSDPRADFIEIMTRTDTSLGEYMNNLRQRRNRQETSGALAAGRPQWCSLGSIGRGGG